MVSPTGMGCTKSWQSLLELQDCCRPRSRVPPTPVASAAVPRVPINVTIFPTNGVIGAYAAAIVLTAFTFVVSRIVSAGTVVEPETTCERYAKRSLSTVKVPGTGGGSVVNLESVFHLLLVSSK